MRAWLAAAVIAAVAAGCAAPYSDSPGSGDSAPSTSVPSEVPASVIVSTTTIAPPTTTTSEAPTTTTTAAPEDLSSWIGVEFSTETSHPNAEGAAILANVEHIPVDFLIDGQPAGVFGWYVGGVGNAFDGPNFTVVVVGDEPNPYAPTEWEQYEEGVEPAEPDPSVEHNLTVWAIEEIGPTSYVITDSMNIQLLAPLLHYAALMTVTQEPWLCEVDPNLQAYLEPDPAGIRRENVLFAFFDSTNFEELEIEEHYPAVLAFTNTDGLLATVPPDSVRCILRLDPENY